MRMVDWRGQVAAGEVVSVIMAEPAADSTVAAGTPVTPAPVGQAADATSPNGNGHSEVVADSGSITLSFSDPRAVLTYSGNGDSGLTTGYIQSNTAGRGVIRITTNQAFTYTGTGSTLVSGAGATGADTLFLAALSLTMTTGTLTALGAGSTALDVNATGGAGSGGLDVTVNGDINSAGLGVIVDQSNAAGTGNLILTSTVGSTITSGGGNAVAALREGSGTITIDLSDSVSATGGAGVYVRDSVRGGDISVTTAAVSALSAAEDGINIQTLSTTADIAVTTNGAVNAGDEGIVAAILDSTATGNITITSNSTINAGNDGIDALNSGNGSITIDADGVITPTDGDGILARSSGGAITVTAAGVVSGGEQGVDLQQNDATGSGALSVTANGDVSGTDGIRVLNLGSGGVTISATGSVTGFAGDAINIVSSNVAAGAISVTTSGGEVLGASGGEGIDVNQSGSGNAGVSNSATINSGSAANTLQVGIDVTTTGSGNISIGNDGAIGTAGDRAQLAGINAAISNAASAGTISVFGSGAIFSVGNGIDLFTNGTGTASVVYGGAINATVGSGIQVDTTSGAITATNGGAINAAAGHGIQTQSTSGNQTLTANANISGGLDGIHAVSTSGAIAVNVNSGNISASDDALDLSSSGAKTVTVGTGRTILGGDLGIASLGTGATTINNSGTITGTGVAIRSETSATTISNFAGGTINGAISLSGLNDSVTNSGAIVGALTLGAGNDLYDGRNGSISGIVNGNAGNDTLRGGTAAETLRGGDGADILEGNGGSDTLTGGVDNDIFRGETAGLNGDTITDFASGDRIVFTNANLQGFSFSLSGNTLTYTGGSLTLTGFTGQLQASAAAGGGVQLTVVGAPTTDVRNDFNGDGRSDVLLRHDGGTITNWLGQPDGSFFSNHAVTAYGLDVSWQVAATGDFNGDNRDDLLLRHDNGAVTDWLGQADGSFFSNHAAASYSLPAGWEVAGAGDFNGDNRDDLLLRHDNGTVTEWLGQANGGFFSNHAVAAYGLDLAWTVAGIGDFNGDNRADLLLRHANGAITDWLGQADGSFFSNHAAASYSLPAGWEVAGIGDFNGDNRDDLLLRHDNGTVTEWLGQANGGFFSNHAVAAYGLDLAWQVAGIGDYNGDNRDDLLLRHANGAITDWLAQADGSFFSNHAAASYSLPDAWQVQPDLSLV